MVILVNIKQSYNEFTRPKKNNGESRTALLHR